MKESPTIHVRPYQPGDEQELAPNLRESDKREIAAGSGLSPLTALRLGVAYSLIACSIVRLPDGAVIGMFGAAVSPEWEQEGLVWMLGADALVKPPIGREFLREAPIYVQAFLLRFMLLRVCVDERSVANIRWLKRLGFIVFARHERFGCEQRPFLELLRIKDHV